MTAVELVMATATFKAANNMALVSPSVIGIFENAINMKKAGFSYSQWESQTTGGKKTKEIVKEIFEFLS